jgi:hypothetical protein
MLSEEERLRIATAERDCHIEQLRQVRGTLLEAERAHQREQEHMRNDLDAARNDALPLCATEQELDRLRRENDSHLKRGIIGTLGEQALQRLLDHL